MKLIHRIQTLLSIINLRPSTEGAAEWYMELTSAGPRLMLKRIVEGVLPGAPGGGMMMPPRFAGPGPEQMRPGFGPGMRSGPPLNGVPPAPFMPGPGMPPGPGGGYGGYGGGPPAPPPGGFMRPPPTGGGLPQRPGMPGCIEFMRTGSCSYGLECSYHHPPGGKM